MRRVILLIVSSLTAILSSAYTGDTTHFTITNDTIKLDAPKEESKSYLAEPVPNLCHPHWQACFIFDYLPSSSNYIRWYLVSDTEELTSPLEGYFIRVGYTDKNIALCRQNGDKVTVLASGEEKRIAAGQSVTIDVTRGEAGEWNVRSSVDGEDLKTEFTFVDNTISGGGYHGFVVYHTSTRNKAFRISCVDYSGAACPEPIKEIYVRVSPDYFSPDGDGSGDEAVIEYSLMERAIANASIFTADGVFVKQLLANAMLPPSGSFTWDGYSASNVLQGVGIYVVVFEAFSDRGVIIRKKVPFVLELK